MKNLLANIYGGPRLSKCKVHPAFPAFRTKPAFQKDMMVWRRSPQENFQDSIVDFGYILKKCSDKLTSPFKTKLEICLLIPMADPVFQSEKYTLPFLPFKHKIG